METSRLIWMTAPLLAATVLLAQTSPKPAQSQPERELRNSAYEANKQIGRCINLGNALEAPHEGDWGVRLKEQYFETIAKAGFDSVRIPVRWSAHADCTEPYQIDPTFMKRVAWAVDNAVGNGLAAIVNMHHYDKMYMNPDEQTPRFRALWRQIAEHFSTSPKNVFFELLNEPCRQLDAEHWNRILKEGLAAVRTSNPDRVVIIGPAHWNNIKHLDQLELPSEDHNIIATFHYYAPFKFTHQGAAWVGAQSKAWLGTEWTGSEEERTAINADFDRVSQWSRKHNRPIFLGEFGAYNKADTKSRARWTKFVRHAAEKRGFAWAYWEFCAGFGAYDPQADKWRAQILGALIDRE